MPEMVFVASLDPIHVLLMSKPGAKMSTHLPWLEKTAMESSMVEAPTVIGREAAAGEYSHAFSLSLPAATAK